MTNATAAPLPHLSERRAARPHAAQGREPGLSLVPSIRPLGRGGLADLLAVHRHNRRERSRALAAA